MSWTIIYGLFFVTFSLPGNKALNKDKLLKGCSRSLLVTRALLLLLNRLPNSNIRAFSLSSFHFIIMCWTWQRVIHHCCSGVWGAAAVVQGLHKYQLLFWREQTGSRGVHLQWEQKLKLRTGFPTELVPCECLLVARFSAVPLAWRLSSRNQGFALHNVPGSAHHSLFHRVWTVLVVSWHPSFSHVPLIFIWSPAQSHPGAGKSHLRNRPRPLLWRVEELLRNLPGHHLVRKQMLLYCYCQALTWRVLLPNFCQERQVVPFFFLTDSPHWSEILCIFHMSCSAFMWC